MEKRLFFVAASVFLVTFTSGCKKNERPPPDRPSSPTNSLTAKVGYLPMVSSLTHFVAEEKGFYQKRGLKVQGERINTSNLLAQEVAAGHVDAAIELAVNPLVNALAKNAE